VSVDHDINFEEDNAQLKARERNDALFCRRHWEHKSIVGIGNIRALLLKTGYEPKTLTGLKR